MSGSCFFGTGLELICCLHLCCVPRTCWDACQTACLKSNFPVGLLPLRLFLDVRGESDLRHASTSSLTLRHHNRDLTLKQPTWHPVTATARHWKVRGLAARPRHSLSPSQRQLLRRSGPQAVLQMQGSLDFDILWPTGISEPMVWRGDVFFNFAKFITSSSPMFDYLGGMYSS